MRCASSYTVHQYYLNEYFNELKNRSLYNVYTSNENKIIKLTICRTGI
jgi:hypothetical protein